MSQRRLDTKTKKPIVILTTVSFLIIFQLTQFSALAITWSPETAFITNLDFRDASPSVIQASDGKIWVAYTSDIDDFLGEIYYVTYNGSAWSEQHRLTYDPNMDDNPGIIQAADGTIWVAWASDREANLNIYYKKSSDDGASWSPDTILTTDMETDYAPSITQTTDGKIWVVWASKRTGNYEIFYKTYDGSQWSTENRLTTNSYVDTAPCITQTWDGKVWVFWSSPRGGNFDVYYMTYDGYSWSPEGRLTTHANADGNPTAVQTRDGLLWVMWTAERSGAQADIYYNTYNGAGWSPTETAVVTSNDDDTQPSIFSTNDGKLWLVWTRLLTSADYDIYYKTTDPIPVHDVAIIGITTSPVLAPPIYQGDKVRIDVTVQNQGTQSETFTVTAYANGTSVGSQQATGIAPGASTIVPIQWDTTGFKRSNYIISAYATPVPNEYLPHQGDNTYTDGTVHVRLLGDVNDDAFVNIMDLALIGVSFGSSVGDPLYKPECDINHDGTIDISDLATAGRNYGKRA